MKNIWGDEKLIKILVNDGVVVMPTDTIYGIVGRALNPNTVLRIYGARKRSPEKPCIILIDSVAELAKFSINLSSEQEEILEKKWPGPVSIIFDCLEEPFFYLHRGTKTLAFRLPKNTDLQNLIKKTGPLIAPSANPEGEISAEDVSKAKEYFDDLVDLYVDGGKIIGRPSKLIKLHKDGSITILRE